MLFLKIFWIVLFFQSFIELSSQVQSFSNLSKFFIHVNELTRLYTHFSFKHWLFPLFIMTWPSRTSSWNELSESLRFIPPDEDDDDDDHDNHNNKIIQDDMLPVHAMRTENLNPISRLFSFIIISVLSFSLEPGKKQRKNLAVRR